MIGWFVKIRARKATVRTQSPTMARRVARPSPLALAIATAFSTAGDAVWPVNQLRAKMLVV